MNVVSLEYGLSSTRRVWTWSVVNLLKDERVCNEFGLLWTWSIMKGGLSRTWFFMNVVCYERGPLLMLTVMSASVLNIVCNEWVCYEYGL